MTETGHPINLVVVRHKHLTRDPPPWLAYVWRARIGIIMVCACWVGITDWPTDVGILVALALTFVLVRLVLRRSGWMSTAGEAPKNGTVISAVDNNRLTCYGDPVELKGLQELKIELFEPVILRLSPFSSKRIETGAIIGAFAILVLGTACFHVGHAYITAGMLACWMALPALCFMLPRYCRVVPGRLEFIRYGIFGTAPSHAEAYSLKGAHVTCRYHEQSLAISTLAPDSIAGTAGQFIQGSSSMVLDLTRVLEPHELVYAVFLAALYARPCPPVATDALVG